MAVERQTNRLSDRKNKWQQINARCQEHMTVMLSSNLSWASGSYTYLPVNMSQMPSQKVESSHENVL